MRLDPPMLPTVHFPGAYPPVTPHLKTARETSSQETLFAHKLRESFPLRNQRTLAHPTFVEGFGFWTGEDIRVEFHPAPPDTGLVFVRVDLDGSPRIPVSVEYREAKPRQTSLSIGNVRVDMIEHLLAALSAMQIDNCEIRVDGPEMPGMDGSSVPFFKVLHKVGTASQTTFRAMRVVVEPFRVGDKCTYVQAKPLPGFEKIVEEPETVSLLSIKDYRTIFQYHLDFRKCAAIGRQDYRFTLSNHAFARDIMSCRTFLTSEEADALRAMGLCKRVNYTNVLVFDENGPIENELYHENECARHKVLDMVGDFALAPFECIGEFRGYCSGHQLNADCVKEIEKHSVLVSV